ncbi:MAG: hypothetical protein KGP12_10775 [Actinomycetales bacterium]|nr:hypothetical protein [Actinomycetales bacterium]
MLNGRWTVLDVDQAQVRLRSGRIGLVTVDVTAPVTSGSLHIDDQAVSLELVVALDRLRTSNFLLQAAARALISRHQAQALAYRGAGQPEQPWSVTGDATAGDVTVALALDIRLQQQSAHESEVELTGSAHLGRVHLPLPGLGTVDDFGFRVDARLRIARA